MPTLPVIHSSRNFGIEIECFGISIPAAVDALHGVGISAIFEGYTHATTNHWKIVTDSSVPNGFEVVSPILSGAEGLSNVQKVAQALVRAGAKVDRRCGFHVHVDARDLRGADVLNCIRRYAQHEAQIDGFMPESRRGTNNSFCRTMEDVVRTVRNVSDSSTTIDVCRRVVERYYKLNVQAYTRHGTIEFRQHNGTVDSRKMVNWIIFCVQFVEDSRAHAVPIPQTTVPGAEVRQSAVEIKFLKLAQLLDDHADRYNPLSGAEIARHLEIEESVVPSYISRFRSRYPDARISARRNRGYYRDSSDALVSMVTENTARNSLFRLEAPPERGVFASLSPDVANYFHERTMDYALR